MKLIQFLSIFLLFENALANLQVLPTRLVLNSRSKSSSLLIKNKSDEYKEYIVDLVYYKMNSEGKLSLDSIANEDSAVNFIKFSPKKIKLNPGEEQTVRILFQNSTTLANRDYRCHIQFNPVNSLNKSIEDRAKKITFELKPRIGVAVPIIISNFSGERKSEIANQKIFKRNDLLFASFNLINYESLSYLVGDIRVTDQDDKTIASLNGINTYIKNMNLELALGNLTLNNPPKRYYIVFRSAEVYGNKELARAEILY